ncbi:MAG: tetratricopeptide repeat protein [Bdellovibrionales bacterium]|nr:tetratricopeptide repeat protein [Bdellovibrionales bacterium]
MPIIDTVEVRSESLESLLNLKNVGPSLCSTRTQASLGSEKFGSEAMKSPASATHAEILQNAIVLIEAGEHSLGRSLLRRVLGQNSRHPLAIRLMGDSLVAEGQIDDAIRCYSELLRICESGDVHFRLAAAYYKICQDDEATNHFLLGLEWHTHTELELFEAFKSLGNLALRNGDRDGAEEYYNRAFALNPNSDVLLVNYGSLEIQRGQLDRAAVRFRAAVHENSENDRAWLGLALVHRQFGDLNLSWGNVERALDLNPRNEIALELIADWATKDNQIARAVPRLESYLQLNDRDAKKSLVLAQFLYWLGRLNQADLEIERFLTLDPHSSDGLKLKKQIEQGLSLHLRGVDPSHG